MSDENKLGPDLRGAGVREAMPDLLPPLNIRNDRDMLNYLAQAFESEMSVCARCGDEESTSTCDSAQFLRDYLAKLSGRAADAPSEPSEDYKLIAHLIGIIFMAGDFVAETANERQLEQLLIKTGHRYKNWAEVDALNERAADALDSQPTAPGEGKWMPADATEVMMHAAQDVPEPRPFGAVYRAMYAAAPSRAIAEDKLRYALQEIIKIVPAHNGEGGGFFVEHHGPDGEYLGAQQINPDDIIQEILSVASGALASSQPTDGGVRNG